MSRATATLAALGVAIVALTLGATATTGDWPAGLHARLALWVSAGGGLAAAGVPLPLLDLGLCARLAWALARRGADARAALAWGWSPLVALEMSGNGHVDGVGAALLAAGLIALLARRADASVDPAAAATDQRAAEARTSSRALRVRVLAGVLLALSAAGQTLGAGPLPPLGR